MYLRHNLMEGLIDDDEFEEKAIGSFVRIRISGLGQWQDMYRLVQVIATKQYKSGKGATDVTLEILNLNKEDIITIGIISNQEFTVCQTLASLLHSSPDHLADTNAKSPTQPPLEDRQSLKKLSSPRCHLVDFVVSTSPQTRAGSSSPSLAEKFSREINSLAATVLFLISISQLASFCLR
ncbi:hypothetical protein ZIOFF_073373 [Zingiber officinale]|uniref:Plus3 domain-containing protein n=1 Tax=Zingiber officinale TaxID=94328 RepID=A0A8J5C7A3_ZINOF|nr:hypothetical protein ZIOFF_073373 [Zingiber officinale]